MNSLRQRLQRVVAVTRTRAANTEHATTQAFDKFAPGSRQALVRAQEEAVRLRHAFIGTEHILLGLLDTPTVLELLRTINIRPEDIRSAVEQAVGEGTCKTAPPFHLTRRAKRAIGLSLEEARQTQSEQLQPAHLLAGILREDEGMGFRVLNTLGITLAEVRKHYSAQGEQ